MKLIIDIPEEVKTRLDEGYIQNGSIISNAILDIVKKGIPLEDIKADIIRHSKICDPEFKDAFEVTVQIIDKHIGDEEV